jgi:hypothetical protein
MRPVDADFEKGIIYKKTPQHMVWAKMEKV